MGSSTRKWISYLLILSLFVTIIPVSGIGVIKTKAADSPIVISSPMGSSSQPTPVTTEKINITGSFYGVTDLTYSVTQLRRLSTGELVEIQTREGVEKPYITGSNFTFYNVQLFDGLNEITVTGKDANGTSTPSERVYVEYSKLPIISTVMYNEQNLKENNVITDKLFNDELLIKGQVNNAESIIAKVNGEDTEYVGSVLSNDTYIIAKIPLQRGKNTLEVIAKNNTKTYPVKLEIIYNDGNPYIGDGTILDEYSNPVSLDSTMNITTNDATINGTLNNFDLNDQLDFVFNSTSFSITYNDFDSTSVGNIVAETPGSYTLTKTGANSFELYYPNVLQNSLNILQFKFTRGIETFSQMYRLEHFDPTLNYVTNTSGLSDTTTSKNIKFYIYTKDNSISEVRHIFPDGSEEILVPISSTPQATETMHEFEVNLEPGFNDIIVRPNASDVNMKSYRILYINSPDVKIINLVNGDRIGDGGQESVIIGDLVNIDLDDRFETKIEIENRMESSSYLLQAGNFTDPTDEFRFEFDLTNKLKTGANEITIEVTDGVTKTTTTITLFYFTSDGPEAGLYIDDSRKIDSNDSFKETEQAGTYETEARYVHFKGNYNNTKDIIFYLNGIRVIQEEVQPIGSGIKSVVGLDPVSGETIRLKLDWDNESFYTDYPIYLHEGTNVFEVEVISSTGTSRSEKVYINRVDPPVKLISPNLDREDVINSNFVEVIVEAADADYVEIDGEEAEYIKLTNDELRILINSLGPEILSRYDLDSNGYLDDVELELIDQGEITGKRFKSDVFLKQGKNTIKYEVEKDGNTSKHEFVMYYAASPDEGAKYKIDFSKSKISVFDKKVILEFPRNTWLIEPDEDYEINNEYINDAYLEFGIVDPRTGKLNKVWNEATEQYELEEFNEPYKTLMPVKVIPPDRTGYAGQIYWIEAEGELKNLDAGLIPTNRGEITLQYDVNIRDDAQNLLAIYHFDRGEEKWVNIGGVVDTKKKTVTASIDEFGYYTVMSKRGTYNDILEHSWAANYLQTMYAKGIMMPESYNRFGSDLLTTRGEFATILVKALDIPINAGPYLDSNEMYPVNPTFVDVVPMLDPANGFYSYEYIETAGRAGIIRGLGQGEFGPDGLLTREQAAIMIARAANYKTYSDIDRSKDALRKIYGDVDKINDYAIPYVQAVTKEGIMSGSTSNSIMLFNPRSYLSRAEASAIAYRLMQDLKILP